MLMLMLSVGCAGAAPATQHASTGEVTDGELSGEWFEYWSRAGQAKTQRYIFRSDGTFQWSAAPSVSAPAAGTPLGKRGSYEVRQNDQGRSLVLYVAVTDLAGCDSACEAGERRPFRVEHQPALREPLALGECPPNVEAEHLDARYACIALGEHAFWRGPAAVQP